MAVDDVRRLFAYAGLHVPGTRKLEARCGPVQGLSREHPGASNRPTPPIWISSFRQYVQKVPSPSALTASWKRAFVPRWRGLESLEKTCRCRQVAVNKGIGGPDRDRTDDLFQAMPDCICSVHIKNLCCGS
jgi:hypothetical protein